MSQVNFVEQFNLFMQYAKRNKLTSYERIFYLGLFYCANDLARQTENFEWPDDYFPVSNMEMNSWTSFDERAIRNTRDSLKQKGLLDFQKGDGKKKDPMYRIFYLCRIGCKIVPDCTGAHDIRSENAGDKKGTGSENAGGGHGDGKTGDENAPDTVGDTVGDAVGDPGAIGGEFAPDPVGEHFINNKLKPVNVNTEAGAKGAGEPPAAPEEPPMEPEEPEEPPADPELAKVNSYYMDHFNPIPPDMVICGLRDYTKELGAEVVVHAMEVTLAEGKVSWSYIRSILQRYRREGLRTMEAVLRSERRREDSKKAARTAGRDRAEEPMRESGGFGLVNLNRGISQPGGLVPGLR